MERPNDADYARLTEYLIKYFCFKLGNDIELARDLTQKSLLRGLELWPKFEGETLGQVFAWHRSIAHWVLREYFLYRRRGLDRFGVVQELQPYEDTDKGGPAHPMRYDTVDEFIDAEYALSRLTKVQRDAVILTAMGYTAAEQSVMLGVNVNSMTSRLRAGRMALVRGEVG